MITVGRARELAGKRLRAKLSAWVVGTVFGPAPESETSTVLSIALHPPTEKQALADEAAAEAWVRQWRQQASNPGIEIDWGTRSWSRLGRQEIPLRARFRSPQTVADFVGGAIAREWETLLARVERLQDRLGGLGAPGADLAVDPVAPSADSAAAADSAVRSLPEAVSYHAAFLRSLDAADFDTLAEVVQWLALNDLGRMRPRQLPIRGVDSKWFGRHTSLVRDLVAATATGIRLDVLDAEARVRIRILDPEMAVGPLDDISAPVDQLAALHLTPHTVLIVENLKSVLALPPMPGTIAIHGSGYAVSVVAGLHWIHGARTVYWGDLDSHGFAILNRLRHHLPGVPAILMDEDTLLAHRDLWVVEDKPSAATMTKLTGSEQRTLERLRSEGNARLEQERIPWEHALSVLAEAIGAGSQSAQRP